MRFETIEHYRRIADEYDVRDNYHIAEEVPLFLGGIDLDAFSEVRRVKRYVCGSI